MNGFCLEATGLLSVRMQLVNRNQQQEPLALPLPMEPLARRAHGARAGNSQTCPPSAYTQSILIAILTVCPCVQLLVAAVSGILSVTALGARALHACILDSKQGRAELWLRSELEINAQTLGRSYETPSIGSYNEHV